MTANTMTSILGWQRLACPTPTDQSRSLSLGVMCEEIAETLVEMRNDAEAEVLFELAQAHKAATDLDPNIDHAKLLKELCDVIVTVAGAAYRMGYDLPGALAEVDRSNWSKLKDGRFLYDMYGKVIKPTGYRPADVQKFIPPITPT